MAAPIFLVLSAQNLYAHKILRLRGVIWGFGEGEVLFYFDGRGDISD